MTRTTIKSRYKLLKIYLTFDCYYIYPRKHEDDYYIINIIDSCEDAITRLGFSRHIFEILIARKKSVPSLQFVSRMSFGIFFFSHRKIFYWTFICAINHSSAETHCFNGWRFSGVQMKKVFPLQIIFRIKSDNKKATSPE